MSRGKQVRVQQKHAHLHDGESGLTQQHSQAIISQQEIVLPDADELAKYQALDPHIVTWLMEHASKEQEFRHGAHQRKLSIRENNARSDRRLNGWGMACAFILFMSGMGLGGFLIYMGHNWGGGIFSGMTLISGAALFVNRNTEKTKAVAEPAPTTEQ